MTKEKKKKLDWNENFDELLFSLPHLMPRGICQMSIIYDFCTMNYKDPDYYDNRIVFMIFFITDQLLLL